MRGDEDFMNRALELAALSGPTSPNPRVGCVLVRAGRIVGEGWHRGPGSPHAEQAALAGAGPDAAGSTAYVTLEPCVHHGRTPPCVPALVEAGVERVVVALSDPDPRVAGRGLRALRAAGVEVTEGVLADRAARLNRAYLHHRRTGRPLVRLKLAFTVDGRLAAADRSARWITGREARRRVHELRAGADAVLVGAGTVLADDPALTVREVASQRTPASVVADATGRVPATARLFGNPEVVVATTAAAPQETQTAWKEAGAEVLVLPPGPGGVDLAELLSALGRRGMLEILCEGGAELATSLLRAGLVDLLEVHLGAVLAGRGGPDLGDLGAATLAEAPRLSLLEVHRFGDDLVAVYEGRD